MQSICYSEWTERECIAIGTHAEGGATRIQQSGRLL
jgi:hypothetical protein